MIKKEIALVIIVTIECCVLQSVPHSPTLVLPGDERLNFTGFARNNGLDCEVFDVTTEDGYILKLFHIPGNKTRPVFVLHGIIDSAETFILRGNTSMAAYLHREGYDVWAGNARGSRYGRRHERLNPDLDKAFWNFSFHEIGYYDLPAMIDFILKITETNTLSAMGHSQGNQVFYVLGATRPEYNEKINILIALAPICFLHNMIPPMDGVVAMGPMINEFLIVTGQEEILGDTSMTRKVIDKFCLGELQGYKLCMDVVFAFAGPDYAEIEPDVAHVLFAHYPSGTSKINGLHLLQVAKKREFKYYDYGAIENLATYNSSVPPKYDLGKVTMRVALISGMNDRISTLKDVKILRKRLPNVVDYRVLEYPLFNHVDFVWAKHMKKYLLPHLFKLLQNFGSGS